MFFFFFNLSNVCGIWSDVSSFISDISHSCLLSFPSAWPEAFQCCLFKEEPPVCLMDFLYFLFLVSLISALILILSFCWLRTYNVLSFKFSKESALLIRYPGHLDRSADHPGVTHPPPGVCYYLKSPSTLSLGAAIPVSVPPGIKALNWTFLALGPFLATSAT